MRTAITHIIITSRSKSYVIVWNVLSFSGSIRRKKTQHDGKTRHQRAGTLVPTHDRGLPGGEDRQHDHLVARRLSLLRHHTPLSTWPHVSTYQSTPKSCCQKTALFLQQSPAKQLRRLIAKMCAAGKGHRIIETCEGEEAQMCATHATRTCLSHPC